MTDEAISGDSFARRQTRGASPPDAKQLQSELEETRRKVRYFLGKLRDEMAVIRGLLRNIMIHHELQEACAITDFQGLGEVEHLLWVSIHSRDNLIASGNRPLAWTSIL